MAQLPIPTVLSLPAVSVFSSVNCLQWSGDGQAVLLTKCAVYILTPDPSVGVELSSVVRQSPDVERLADSIRPVGWLRTMIEFDRALVHHWPADCQDWSAVSLGSLDPFLQAVTLSPSNLTVDAGCVLALLNSNLELTIWGAGKNHLQGEWIKLQDITSNLKAMLMTENPELALAKTLQAQTTCIGWSSQTDFGLTPAPSIDGSLLAAGNRAGSITFLRFLGKSGEIQCVETVPVSDRWVNHLAWSSWRAPEHGMCEAFLACGCTDGSVILVKVVQSLSPTIQFASDHELKQSFEIQDVRPCEPDGRGITGMKWVDVNAHGVSSVLVFQKSGVLHLWSGVSAAFGWSGSRALLLRTQKLSVGSSALSPTSGISYIRRQDALVVSLSDGSFHVVHNLSVEPSMDPPPAATGFTSGGLSAASRSVYLKTESEQPQFKDVNCINGMMSYDGGSMFVWIYESCRPTDFSYKHDARHVNTFVLAQLWNDDIDSGVLDALAEKIAHAKAVTGEAPISLLRPVFLHLREPQRLSRLYLQILEILRRPISEDTDVQTNIPPYSGELSHHLREEFKTSISRDMFGWDAILSQRIRLSVATFCQKHSEQHDIQEAFGQAAGVFFTNMWHHIQRTILRHLAAVDGFLTPEDIPFVRRTILHASLPGSPADLTREAQDLSAKLQSIRFSGNEAADTHPLEELCPACHALVPLDDSSTAVCPNGHVWARCCITSFLLSTPMVRTCMGCSRKAFLPLSPDSTGVTWLPNSARDSWVVRDLLDATRRCPFCGSNFVTLV